MSIAASARHGELMDLRYHRFQDPWILRSRSYICHLNFIRDEFRGRIEPYLLGRCCSTRECAWASTDCGQSIPINSAGPTMNIARQLRRSCSCHQTEYMLHRCSSLSEIRVCRLVPTPCPDARVSLLCVWRHRSTVFPSNGAATRVPATSTAPV